MDSAVGMKSVSVVESLASFPTLLAEVEAGMEVRTTRGGRTVARLVPEPVSNAAGLSEPFCADAPPNEVDP
jgi:antitoxin (DNA-binding transcriptional repressor) of toxin-antitoxin stability system